MCFLRSSSVVLLLKVKSVFEQGYLIEEQRLKRIGASMREKIHMSDYFATVSVIPSSY